MARLAVLAASLGAAHASCQVRLVNEAAASVGPVTLKDASGSILVSNLAPGSASSYVSFACDTPSFWASSATWAYNATSPGAVSRATVLVSSQSPAEPQAAAFVDASSALSDQLGPYIDGSQPSYMDQCTLRVLNVSKELSSTPHRRVMTHFSHQPRPPYVRRRPTASLTR